jgi:hypothetical protein
MLSALKVLKGAEVWSCSCLWQKQLDEFVIGFPLLRRNGLGVQIQRDLCVGVPEEFLSSLDVPLRETLGPFRRNGEMNGTR